LKSSITQFIVAYDTFDPFGSINIKWDVVSWTPDGYVAMVRIENSQMYRNIMSPGWTLGWTWAKKEVIWSMVGAQATDQGDCSKFKGDIPHCCKKNPTIIDLLPGVPNKQRFSDCCKGGLLKSWGQDPSAAVSSFQLSVGHSGTSNKTIKLPEKFVLLGPGQGYTCSPATIVSPSVFFSSDGHRRTQAMMTWTITCSYSSFLVSKNPPCCVSMSSFYNPSITPCPSCACGCQDHNNCVANDLKISSSDEVTSRRREMVQCTDHMCPIRVHWHVKTNYKEYWKVKIAITNFSYLKSYPHWTLVVQHPNLHNLTKAYSFVYKPLSQYRLSNDTGMFYGMKYYNDLLMEAGPNGHVETELILKKDKKAFTLEQGWAFPMKVYFNGGECMMPPPDSYPHLPNSAYSNTISTLTSATLLLFLALL
ncbi:hypothetical protein F8388_001219, partial [Cannabis sativa]